MHFPRPCFSFLSTRLLCKSSGTVSPGCANRLAFSLRTVSLISCRSSYELFFFFRSCSSELSVSENIASRGYVVVDSHSVFFFNYLFIKVNLEWFLKSMTISTSSLRNVNITTGQCKIRTGIVSIKSPTFRSLSRSAIPHCVIVFFFISTRSLAEAIFNRSCDYVR